MRIQIRIGQTVRSLDLADRLLSDPRARRDLITGQLAQEVEQVWNSERDRQYRSGHPAPHEFTDDETFPGACETIDNCPAIRDPDDLVHQPPFGRAPR